MSNKQSHIDYDQIAKYLSGQSAPEEEQAMEQWIDGSDQNLEIFNQCKKLLGFEYIDSSASTPPPKLDVKKAWANVEQRLDLNDQTMVVDIPVDREDESDTGKILSLPRKFPWAWVAATLVLGMTIVFFFLNKSSEKEVMLAGTEVTQEYFLPDSSRILLASNSLVKYRSSFGTSNRNLELTGKAYFEVQRDEHLRFVVSTQSGRVEVLGTAFAVEENAEMLYVIVERGMVQLISTLKTGGTEYMVLERMEKGVLDLDTGTLNKIQLKNLNELYWVNKRLNYRQELLSVVFMELSRIFEIDILFDPDKIADCRITGVFVNQSFEEIMENMSISMDFDYTITSNKVEIRSDGCFSN